MRISVSRTQARVGACLLARMAEVRVGQKCRLEAHGGEVGCAPQGCRDESAAHVIVEGSCVNTTSSVTGRLILDVFVPAINAFCILSTLPATATTRSVSLFAVVTLPMSTACFPSQLVVPVAGSAG